VSVRASEDWISIVWFDKLWICYVGGVEDGLHAGTVWVSKVYTQDKMSIPNMRHVVKLCHNVVPMFGTNETILSVNLGAKVA